MPIVHSSDVDLSIDDWAGLAVEEAMAETMTGRSFGAWCGGFGEGDRARKVRLREERAQRRRRRRDGNRERAAGPA